jgi:hypothetical protein
MAKLLIFRGEAQLDARELTEKTLRIGRGTQNDIGRAGAVGRSGAWTQRGPRSLSLDDRSAAGGPD